MAVFYHKRTKGEYEVYTYMRLRIRLLQILIIGGLGLFFVFTYSNLPFREYVALLSIGLFLTGCFLSALGGVQQLISQAKSGTLFIKRGQQRTITKLDNGDTEVWIKIIK